jgi:hypothetical protein
MTSSVQTLKNTLHNTDSDSEYNESSEETSSKSLDVSSRSSDDGFIDNSEVNGNDYKMYLSSLVCNA